MLRKEILIAVGLISAITLTEYIATHNFLVAQSIYTIMLIALVAVSAVVREYPDSAFEGTNPDTFSKYLLALAIVPIVRISTYSLPGVYFTTVENLFLYSLPMFASAIFIIHLHGDIYNSRNIGVTSNKLKLQVAVVFTGIPIGLGEYFILKPDALADSLQLADTILPVTIIFFSTGFCEELVYRGIIQRASVEALGKYSGIILTAFLFAALHLGNSFPDAVYVFPIALFWGYFVYRTRSILGVILAHGVTNMILFIIGPLLLA